MVPCGGGSQIGFICMVWGLDVGGDEPAANVVGLEKLEDWSTSEKKTNKMVKISRLCIGNKKWELNNWEWKNRFLQLIINLWC